MKNLKALDINISDITQENVQKKFEKLEKSLNVYSKNAMSKRLFLPRTISYLQNKNKVIKSNDNGCLILNIQNITTENVEKKLEEALRAASFVLDVPVKTGKGEGFNYKSQEELADKWFSSFSNLVRQTYDFVVSYFGLPKATIMTKSTNLTWKGKVLYSPESGEPIKQAEWDHFVKTLDKFLNRNITDASKKIILDSKTLGKILNRMLKTNTLKQVQKMSLDSLKMNNKSFDWISDSVKNMKNAFGKDLTQNEMERINIIQQSAAEKITKIDNAMKSDIKQILIDGVLDKKSKSQISQALFDKMIGHNRDFQRIADTELQKTFNNSFIQEEVHNADKDEKIYFKRIEVIDANTCEYCIKINGLIAVWSNIPLSSGSVKDRYAKVAIWEGKEWTGKKLTRIEDVPCGICHPYCRGSWIRYYPETDKNI